MMRHGSQQYAGVMAMPVSTMLALAAELAEMVHEENQTGRGSGG